VPALVVITDINSYSPLGLIKLGNLLKFSFSLSVSGLLALGQAHNKIVGSYTYEPDLIAVHVSIPADTSYLLSWCGESKLRERIGSAAQETTRQSA